MARPPSDIAERLARAARERFLEQGVDGASLRAIARDAGTSLGMVYYYFPTKDELFFAAIEQVYGPLVSKLESAVRLDSSLEAQVSALYEVLGTLGEDDLKVLRLIVKEGLSSSARLSGLSQRFLQGHVNVLVATFVRGANRGEARSDIPAVVLAVTTFLTGLFPQIVARRLRDADAPAAQLFPDAQSLGRALAEIALRGVRSAGSLDECPSELTNPRDRRK